MQLPSRRTLLWSSLALIALLVLGATAYFELARPDGCQTCREDIVVATAIDADGDGLTDWARLTLAQAIDPPYPINTLRVAVDRPDGRLLVLGGPPDAEHEAPTICRAPELRLAPGPGDPVCGSDPDGASLAWGAPGDTLALGEHLYIPCLGAPATGDTGLELTIEDRQILSTWFRCEQPAGG